MKIRVATVLLICLMCAAGWPVRAASPPARIVGAPVEIIERATTLKLGVVRFAQNGVASSGQAVMATDTRLGGATYMAHASKHLLHGPDAISASSTTTAGLTQFATNGSASTGRAVLATDTRLSDARTPLGHQATHRRGGADALPAGSTTTAGLIALAADGVSDGAKAVAANDSRLGSGGQSGAHAATHRLGAQDSIGAASATTAGLETAADKALFDKVISEQGGPAASPPPARWQAEMTYSPVQGLMGSLLYGGMGTPEIGASGILQDTWRWDGRNWTLLGDIPSRRQHPAMAYDANRRTHVLWGGDFSNVSLDDTWETDGAGAWHRRSTVHRPPNLAGSGNYTLCYDPGRRVCILVVPTGAGVETWEYDGEDWRLKDSALSNNHGRRWIVGSSDAGTYAYAGEAPSACALYKYTGNSWTQLWPAVWPQDPQTQQPPTPEGWNRGPVAQGADGLCWLPAIQRMVLAGFVDGGGTPSAGCYTWNPAVEGNATQQGFGWAETTAMPAATGFGSMVYDVGRSQLFFFRADSDSNGGTWGQHYLFNGSSWSTITPGGDLYRRSLAALDYAPAEGRALLFGGWNAQTGVLNDTWQLSATWSQPLPSRVPPAMMGYAMAQAPSGEPLLFGGWNPWSGLAHPLSETWTYTPTAGGWLQLTPSSSPHPLSYPMMALDTERHVTVLYAGGDQGDADTWEWDGVTWTRRTPATNPGSKWLSGFVYDSARHRCVLFSGATGLYGYLGAADTWTYDGTNWTLEAPGQSPPARARAFMAYDEATQRVTLFGGYGNAGRLADTWEWNGTDWAQKSPAVKPEAKDFGACTYDALHQQIVTFGGLDTAGTLLNDTWLWDGIIWGQNGIMTVVRAGLGVVLQQLGLGAGPNQVLRTATFTNGEVFVPNSAVTASTVGLGFLFTPSGTAGQPYPFSNTAGSGMTFRSTAGSADQSTIRVLFIEPQ